MVSRQVAKQISVEWPILRAVPAPERAQLISLARPRRYQRGEVVCREGDPADCLHLVARGRLSVAVSVASGATTMLRLLSVGDHFGEVALLRSSSRRTATVRALEDTATLAIGGSAFRRLRETHPRVERAMTEILARQLESLGGLLVEALHESLEVRVHRRLMELAGIYRNGRAATEIPLTQTQLAELAGGSRPSVNQVLQRLEDAGIVALGRGTITVLDPARLSAHTH